MPFLTTREEKEKTDFPASLNPIKVTKEEPASDRLLNASAVMEMELLMVPAMNFPANRHIFKNIPTIPVSIPYACRTSGEDVFSLSLINIPANNVTMFFPLSTF